MTAKDLFNKVDAALSKKKKIKKKYEKNLLHDLLKKLKLDIIKSIKLK